MRQLNNPIDGVQLTTERTLQAGETVNQILTSWLADNLLKKKNGKARRIVMGREGLVCFCFCFCCCFLFGC